ncbi:MAG: sigma-70 family RNA polymerase sigma factor [Rhizobiales bacterium]|nr:sigma-70 family RNA polymerase sigma factor [Hyphomicrobiales bacterium]
MGRLKSRFDIVGQLGHLRRYARTLTRDGADAEDLVHETLLRAYERRNGFRAGGNLRAWLLSILHNTYIDGFRARRAEARRVAQAALVAETQFEAPQEHSVRFAQLRRTFLSLPEGQRAALHLVAIEGLSYEQAASTLGIPTGTLMSRLGRARANLRAMEDKERPIGSEHLRIVGGRDGWV